MSAIHAAMVAIAKNIAVEGIGKSRKNAQQGYNFRGVDDVMNAFAPILATHSVFVRPRFADRVSVERTTAKGTALFYVTVSGEFTFTHEDGSELSVGPFFGEAMDSGDKATNKAMAVAFKYAMFQTFCVPLEGVTGGDADLTTHEVTAIKARPADGMRESLTDDQRERIDRYAISAFEYWEAGDVAGAAEFLSGLGLTSEEKIALYDQFDSKFRSALKKHHQAIKEAA